MDDGIVSRESDSNFSGYNPVVRVEISKINHYAHDWFLPNKYRLPMHSEIVLAF
jgi:hypothetical protein